jgi:hypothetical protein
MRPDLLSAIDVLEYGKLVKEGNMGPRRRRPPHRWDALGPRCSAMDRTGYNLTLPYLLGSIVLVHVGNLVSRPFYSCNSSSATNLFLCTSVVSAPLARTYFLSNRINYYCGISTFFQLICRFPMLDNEYVRR